MRHPKQFLSSGSFGTMGFGMPTAVGACYANPSSTVLVIDGDGSFKMNMGEVHTMGALGLPIKILLLNNERDGMVHALEDVTCESRHSATVRQGDVNFADLAKCCNFCYSRRVTDRSELDDALKEFFAAKGPSMLEVKTDANEAIYPVVPSGTSYQGMKLGPYIKEVK
jgi:acetolactate synthase-1/2/3 large subunit